MPHWRFKYVRLVQNVHHDRNNCPALLQNSMALSISLLAGKQIISYFVAKHFSHHFENHQNCMQFYQRKAMNKTDTKWKRQTFQLFETINHNNCIGINLCSFWLHLKQLLKSMCIRHGMRVHRGGNRTIKPLEYGAIWNVYCICLFDFIIILQTPNAEQDLTKMIKIQLIPIVFGWMRKKVVQRQRSRGSRKFDS